MGRRVFLHFSWLSAGFYLNWLLFLKKRPIRVTYRSIPKSKNVPAFQSVTEFFQSLYKNHPSSHSVVEKYIKEKKILNLRSRLSFNKKEVHSDFIIKDSVTFIKCIKEYVRITPDSIDPVKHKVISINIV